MLSQQSCHILRIEWIQRYYCYYDTTTLYCTYYYRNAFCYGQDFGSIQNFCFDLWSRKMQEIGHDGIYNKILVGTYFITRKGRNAVNQESSSPLDIAFQKSLKAAVHLETVSTIPVSTTPLGGHLLCLKVGSIKIENESMHACMNCVNDRSVLFCSVVMWCDVMSCDMPQTGSIMK